jgi:hypothetical protein
MHWLLYPCHAVAREPSLGYYGSNPPSLCRGPPTQDGRPISPLGLDRERGIPIAKRSQGAREISFRFDTPRASESQLIPYSPTRGHASRQCRGHFGGFTFHDAANSKIIDECCGLFSDPCVPSAGTSIVLLFSCHPGSYVAEGVSVGL